MGIDPRFLKFDRRKEMIWPTAGPENKCSGDPPPFLRNTRNTRPTRAGMLLLEHVPRVFAALAKPVPACRPRRRPFSANSASLSDGNEVLTLPGGEFH